MKCGKRYVKIRSEKVIKKYDSYVENVFKTLHFQIGITEKEFN